ncbi:MAG: MacB family efflux pump subunit [Alphaproteobacteria bacterium]
MNDTLFDVWGVAALDPLIELKDVRKTFVTAGGVGVEALRGVSLSIYPGEFVALMGQSGSGKTTLMNLLGLLDKPTSGEYRFAGRRVSALQSDDLAFLRREAFGFVFQSYNLIATLNALENVEVPAVYAGLTREERQARGSELLSRLGLSDRMHHRPNQLSGGQQQRVSIARALMNGGKVLLADEPTGALDSRSGAEVMGLLRSLADEGHTVILITHDRAVAENADRLIEMKDGEIVADSGVVGPHAPGGALEIDAQLKNDQPETRRWSGLADAASMALRALRVNIFRTVLTLLGIMIGVASVVALLAIGEGAKQSVLDRISSMGNNLLLVRPGARNSRGFGGFQTLTPDDAIAIGSVEGVAYSVPENVGNVTARYGNIDYQTSADATSASLPAARDWNVAQGAFFSAADERSYAAVAVLGQTVVDNLFPGGENPIGKHILLKNVPFLVIGVMEQKGANAGGGDTDDSILVPLSTGSLRLFGQRNLRSITVSVADAGEMSAVDERVRQMLISRHGGQEDFRINNMAEIMATVSETQNTMTILLGSIAAISLLVGGIGVMNIMLVSVTERTREIGIRMATGARTRNILEQFLTEAVVVSGLGGIIGIVGGASVALFISVFGMPIKFTLGPVLLAFSCAAATGLVFGFAPALKAARLDPVVALSSE